MNYLVLDLETANSDCASICQIGIVHVEGGEIAGTVSRLVDPEDYFDPWNIKVHGIQPHQVAGQPAFPEVWRELAGLVEGRIVVTQGSFDRTAIHRACARYGLPITEANWLDNTTVVRRTWSQFAKRGYSLGNLANHFGIAFRHHDALEDAIATAHIFRRALDESGKTASQWHAEIAGRASARASIVLQGVSGADFSGQSVVFTGRMRIKRAEAARLAAERGFSIESAMTPTTSLLCIGREGTVTGKSAKEREAERLRAGGHPVSIVSEDEFWQMLRA
ncbi:exonuclease domain-containing protein [Microvirga pudoricolor]|uniref:exonuclease domain-containing protein n=1 Tax=Microvirga pudoricolor TaxID=2778729 RepID=UPI00194F1800|nr:exonuclease domain-containing protein [Microvirga pudoricolor]MBM6592918.1 3'-5' exoribonuclease [Microvirga pudoricolor]